MPNKKVLNTGDRVFIPHRTDILGTIVAPAYVSSRGYRQAVHWDISDMVTEWDPAFLFTENTPWEEIPNQIRRGNYVFDKNSKMLYRVEALQEKHLKDLDDDSPSYPL